MANVSANHVEFANRARLITRLFELGFGVYVPVIDEGIDLVAYREADKHFRAIQLKTRWTIDKKYLGRDIWIAFPDDQTQDWFLAPHDEMVKLGEDRRYCVTKSWVDRGLYHLAPLGHELRIAMSSWRVSLGF
jgi:hypothetical protein